MVEDVAASCQLIQGHFGFNGGASGFPSSGSSALGAGLPGPSSSSSSAAATAAGAGAGATNAGYSGASCSENMQVGRTKQYFFICKKKHLPFTHGKWQNKKAEYFELRQICLDDDDEVYFFSGSPHFFAGN